MMLITSDPVITSLRSFRRKYFRYQKEVLNFLTPPDIDMAKASEAAQPTGSPDSDY